jgi:type I restriction enzyme M protein
MSVAANKRAEARTRYYTRAEATRIGWNVQHPSLGGSFLEEQEIVDYFPALSSALGNNRPDFVGLLQGQLSTVIECKSDWKAINTAVDEAREYADTINQVKNYMARLAVGVAGTPDKRVLVRCLFRNDLGWTDLVSHGYPLTQIPAPAEAELAIGNGNGTTDVVLPDEREFFDAAINISRILRLAKIEEAVRPKVIGAIILALYHSNFPLESDTVIENINTNVRAAVNKFNDVALERREFLAHTLELSTEADGLRGRLQDVVHQLERLNVRSIMRSGVDFLGQFYETFLRYGQDAKKLGIVFTPRHITRMCADLVDVQPGNTVYDPACGTGGFLVAAFDKMNDAACHN